MKENQENFFKETYLKEWLNDVPWTVKIKEEILENQEENMTSKSMLNKMDSPSPLELLIMFEDWGKN